MLNRSDGGGIAFQTTTIELYDSHETVRVGNKVSVKVDDLGVRLLGFHDTNDTGPADNRPDFEHVYEKILYDIQNSQKTSKLRNDLTTYITQLLVLKNTPSHREGIKEIIAELYRKYYQENASLAARLSTRALKYLWSVNVLVMDPTEFNRYLEGIGDIL